MSKTIAQFVRPALRLIAAIGFIGAGVWHFHRPEFYRRIVPPYFPSPAALVAISGVCEIAGGIGLLPRRTRRVAGWGLIALLIAVFPANIYMVIDPQKTADGSIPTWALWCRLPFQALFIVWIWFVALTKSAAD